MSEHVQNEMNINVRLCDIDLVPIIGDLMDGIEVRMIDMENNIVKLVDPPAPPGYIYVQLSSLEKIDDNRYKLKLESIVRDSYAANDAWSLFLVCGCELIDQQNMMSGKEKNKKHTQTFIIDVKKDSPSPYLQLICNHWRIKFDNEYYSRNDTLTVYLVDSLPERTVPYFIHIRPTSNQTIVPLRSGQKIHLLIDRNKETLDFRPEESQIVFNQSVHMGSSYPSLGSPLMICIFSAESELSTSEYFEIITKSFGFNWNTPSRIVLAVQPEDNFGGSFVPVFEPVTDCRIYTGGYDGIKVRFQSRVSLRVHESCPAKIVYLCKSSNWYEFKISLKCQCHSLLLTKEFSGWVVRAETKQ